MIRHQVFFDTLGSLREDSASWRSVFAGLSVMRLVDAYTDNSASVDPANWAQLHSVRSAIDEVNAGDPIRGVLSTVLEETIARGTIDEVVCRSLLAYGRSLDYEASWSLATDVYQTVAKVARPEKNARLAVDANVAVGGAARRNGDWETSARAYSQAAYVADTMGDKQGVLTVQVGIANTYFAKGNLPQAQTILDDVIAQARDCGYGDVQAVALHSRAAVAGTRGEHADGLRMAYEALELTSKPSARDAILQDIGAMFTAMGMHESARDAHLILAATAQSQFTRWAATLNLMELASVEGNAEMFDSYAKEVARAPLGPWLRAYYLLILGEGLLRLGRDAAEDALREARAYAESNQLFQLVFKAEDALSAAHPSDAPSPPANPLPHAYGLEEVVRGVSELRKTVVAA